ncbi:methyl-accepting chemotaxis protein [Kineothrix sp. MB12-C1]|uniref:methyl-accepting chemotaxis protein n=1 Tax=Kineothrix sp. MB12-C1 TaxID=3070215 RepID=UPI0027D29882|nr:methyl-accepting chemotaxis protein [Kineothrix sp. MB12-C1]WMC94312.1 methyl-accepting chemotaxis protein [Kineothrix sp. MB12-C1]
MRLRDYKVRTKMLILGIIIVVAMAGICAGFLTSVSRVSNESLDKLEAVMLEDYDRQIKTQVYNALSMLDAIYAKHEAGEYTLEEAKKLGADLLREMRYGEGCYFWADTYNGDNIVLLGNATEGTNRIAAKDANGYEMVKEIIRVGQEADGGYADYWFPKEGSEESFPKRSYSKAFEPFGWVVGTGNYIDDINIEVDKNRQEQQAYISQSLMKLFIIVVIVLLIEAFFTFIIAREIIKALKTALAYNELLGQGDFTVTLPDSFLARKDDFGVLSRTMDQMKNNLKELISEIHGDIHVIKEMTGSINDKVLEVNVEMETVSATTQELAASMEETAASSEEITAMSQEIEVSAKNIAGKSEEGAQRVADILKRAEIAREETRKDHEAARQINGQIKTALGQALENIKIVEEISALSDSIMGITSQTNMLALNASIEAARAGEAGKGFAVVAEQIRILAEQSRQTVVNIQQITSQVKEAVSELSLYAKQLLEFVSTDVSRSYNNFDGTVQAYQEDSQFVDGLVNEFSKEAIRLLDAITGIMEAIEEVGHASNEGAEGTTDIASKVTDVVMQTGQMTNAVQEANERVLKVNGEIRKFKTE